MQSHALSGTGQAAENEDAHALWLSTQRHRRKRPVGISWRMDETYIRVKGEWRYLYRAVDKHGQTIDFLLTEHRDKEAALRLLKKPSAATEALRRSPSTAVTPMQPPSRATTRHMAPISSSVRGNISTTSWSRIIEV